MCRADNRKKILALLKADPTRSDRSIADEVDCSPTTVGTLRRTGQ
jgi:DNA-binding Lrp family transcriptional regulator